MDKYAILVKDLEIRYKMFQNYAIKQNLFKAERLKKREVKAVDGLSFAVRKGEIMGIVGKNGSGKSTLLRALAGLFTPDNGIIELFGNSISLLAIGAGFQTKLTGRENIMLSGMLLGYTEEQVRERMDEIIEFSELAEFIDMPVRTYSSGMHSKLAFSISAVMETDIMLIDEVLSVGDVNFRKKSFNKMKELISQGDRTVIIVSHNNHTLLELCDRLMWMHEGKMQRIGDPGLVIREYKRFMDSQEF